MSRVSVLLTSYNHREFLPAALESIRAQTYKEFEIIALDDGSSDGSREWLSEQKDIRCVFNERNLGTYGSLNEGLRKASGEFVAILNDDDVWMPEKLQRQVATMDANQEIGLVHTGGHFIDAQGKRTEGNPLGFRFPTFETGDILLGLVYENKIIASAALARRSCFDEVGEFDAGYFGSGDWQMWFRIAEVALVGFVNEPLTQYRVHGSNASHKLERIWRDDEQLRTWMIPRLRQLEVRFPPKDARLARGFNYAALGTVKKLNGDSFGARECYGLSVRENPFRVKTYLRWLATWLPEEAFRKTL